jgi:hypothetical protein
MLKMYIREPVKRYFGSRSSPDIGTHNIKKATFLLVIRLMEDSGYPLFCPVNIIASRCPGVSQAYCEARAGVLEKFGLISRKPSLAISGRPTLVVRITKAGREFLSDFKQSNPDRYNQLKALILSKNDDLRAVDVSTFRSNAVIQLQHNLVTQKPIAKPAEPPHAYPAEFLHYKSGMRSLVIDLSQPGYNEVESDFAPVHCVSCQNGGEARELFKELKSGRLKLDFVDGEIKVRES